MSIRRILHLILALSLALGWLAAPAQTASAMGLIDEPLLWVPNDVVQTMAVADDTLYLKADADSAAHFRAAAGTPFTYAMRDGSTQTMET